MRIVVVRSLLLGAALAGVAIPLQAQEAAPPTPAADVLGAVGIGVADLAASTAFYVEVLGMKQLQTFHVGDLDEVVVGFPQGTSAAVVLMHWQNDAARKYDGTNVKLVFDVDDPAAVLARVRARGGKVEREAMPIEVLNGRIVGLGRDPDNYLIELLKR